LFTFFTFGFILLLALDETDLKQPKIHRKIQTSLWILKISKKKNPRTKSLETCQMFVISKQKTIP
jgi:hypothetical protein